MQKDPGCGKKTLQKECVVHSRNRVVHSLKKMFRKPTFQKFLRSYKTIPKQAAQTVRIKVKQCRATFMLSSNYRIKSQNVNKTVSYNISFIFYKNSETNSMVGSSMFPHVSSVAFSSKKYRSRACALRKKQQQNALLNHIVVDL